MKNIPTSPPTRPASIGHISKSAPTPKTKALEIPSLVSQLNERLVNLRESVVKLSQRLSPVLRSVQPNSPEGEGKSSVSTELGGALSQALGTIQEIRNTVAAVDDTLEL